MGWAREQTLSVPSNNSLSSKIARNPLRFGLIAGFLGVPLLWMAGDSLVHVAMGQGRLPMESFWSYEFSGALMGAFLGGQGTRVWAQWRSDNIAQARSIAFGTGLLGVAIYVAQAALFALTSPFFFSTWGSNLLALFLQRDLPFLLCLLLLFGGLCGPRSAQNSV